MLKRFATAGTAGVLWALSFPQPGVAGFAWVAPGLLLLSACGAERGQAFRLGYFAGLVHFLFSLRWLLAIPFPLGAVSGWVALSAYLALFPAVWVWLCWAAFPGGLVRHSRPPDESLTPLRVFDQAGRSRRMLWGLCGAAAWVALEMAQARVLSGFPWNFIGVSQYRVPVITHIASWAGVYGVSFLVVWVSVSLWSALALVVSNPSNRWAWRWELLPASVAFFAVFVMGLGKLLEKPNQGAELRMVLIQPSIPQDFIWNPKEGPRRFDKIMRMTELALATKPHLVVWPESSLPSLDELQQRELKELIARNNVWAVVGGMDAIPRPGATKPEDYDAFNAAFLFDTTGSQRDVYHKRNLVIFGEYVPLGKWLPFLKWFTPVGEDLAAGTATTSFRVENPRATFPVLICFEDIFPHKAREHVNDETDFILNLTNNGWFGEGSAQWQHAANAAFRAIENGVPLIRCTNNGLTCWIDEYGRMREVDFTRPGEIYGEGFKSVALRLAADGQPRRITFYRRNGDIFGWCCVALTSVMLAAPRVRKESGTKID